MLGMKVGNGEGRQAARNAAESGADGFNGQMKSADRGAEEDGDDGSGNAFGDARQKIRMASVPSPRARADRLSVPEWATSSFMRGRNSLGTAACAQAEEVLDLRGGDEDGDSVGEADDHHARDEANHCAEAGKAHESRMMPAMSVTMARPLMPKRSNDAGNDDDECAGGSANLGARAAERGDDESGDDGGVEAGLRRDA